MIDRQEFEKELDTVKKWSPYENNATAAANAAVNRLLKYFDEVQRDLGYVAALRRNLSDTVDQNVDLEIEVQSLKRKLEAKADTDTEGDDE